MHVCHFYDSSFASEFFRNTVGELIQKGVKVSLVELASGTPPTWLAETPGVSYLTLKIDTKLQYPLAVRRLSRYLENEGVDILHTHLYYAGLIGVLTKRIQKKTIVALMRHHTSVVRMLGWRPHIVADKWMAEKADHVMTVSRAARHYMADVDGIRRNDIEVVYLGFDFKKMSPNVEDRLRLRREFGFSGDDLVIGYVAHFAKGKGQMQLIEAFAKIVAEIPRAKLFLVGRGVSNEVREAASQFTDKQIVFAGWRDDVAACLNAMDIFVQPSLSEAFSQVLIEAMGVELPVIATDVGGAGEVIDHGINGILIEPGDTEAIAANVAELSQNVELRTRIALAGRESVLRRFTVDKTVDRQLELYQRWIAEREDGSKRSKAKG